ncbi:lysozyme inhibitor LprI family protein [Chromobacterium rhizoryzae]|uniref:lysozyme inhibitor LprI family protein n=1 Tax=Chromobacterium rhizoryzae TaxID=1778675 RepID=UPI001D08CA7A|nr:lysozyme inhibitor LprI family protein [Chromobacterium rhizoryzae]
MKRMLMLAALALPAVCGAGALDDCMRAEAQSPAVSVCLQQRLSKAEAELSRGENQAAAAMRELDQITGNRYRARLALSQSGRAFKTYLDKQCRWVASSYASGNGADQARTACRVDLIEQRLSQLAAHAGN